MALSIADAEDVTHYLLSYAVSDKVNDNDEQVLRGFLRLNPSLPLVSKGCRGLVHDIKAS